MISLLQGTPLFAMCPHVIFWPRPNFLEDFDLFIVYLRINYGNPDKLGTVRRKRRRFGKPPQPQPTLLSFSSTLQSLIGKIKTQS